MAERYGLEIRSATAADAAGLAELMSEPGAAVASRTMADRLEAARRSPGAVLVALEWGPPSGLIALSWRSGLQADGPVAQIDTLFVHADVRRRGVGRLLLKAGAHAARSAGCSYLRAPAAEGGRSGLTDFYRSAGFAKAGTVFERPLRKRAPA